MAAKSRNKKPRPKLPASLRPMTKQELQKLGYSEKARRYVSAAIKRVTKRVRTFSRRARDTLFRITLPPETRAKASRKSREWWRWYHIARSAVEQEWDIGPKARSKEWEEITIDKANQMRAYANEEMKKPKGKREYQWLFDQLPVDQWAALRALLGS